MANMLPRDLQLSNEYLLSRKFIDKAIDLEIRENPAAEAKVEMGVELLTEWLSQSYYQSKEQRLEALRGTDLEPLVRKIFVGLAYCQTPETFVSMTSQLSTRLGWSDRVAAITTVAEMVAVLCNTDAYDITKASREASLLIQSRLPLSERLMRYIRQSKYLPPMVVEPENLKHNFESPYLTYNDCVILKGHNAHSECVSLDVINTRNKVALCLDYDFVSTVEETPSKTPETPEAMQQWVQFKKDSLDIYLMLIKQGNRFYIPNKVDKRGRLYCQGYHVNPQGTAYKKASVDLADKQVVTGVPEHFKRG